MKRKIRRRGVWAIAGVMGLLGAAAAFAVWGPHANAARADASGVAAEWRAWREAEDAAGFEAWDALLAAGARVEEFGRERFPGNRADMKLALERLLTGAWDDPRHEEDREQLGETGELVEEILAAAEKPFGSWRPQTRAGSAAGEGDALGEIVGAAIPSGVSERQRMVELLRVSMRESAARGDWEGVERLTRGHLRLARHALGGEGAVTAMAEMSIWAIGVEECVRVCVEEGAPREACERLARVIEEGRLPAEVLLRGAKGERLGQRGFERRSYNRHGYRMMWTDEVMEWGPLKSSLDDGAPAAWERAANVRAYFEPRLEAVDREIGEAMDVLEGWARLVEAEGEDWEAIRREGERVRERAGALEHPWAGAPGMVRMWLAVEQTRRGAMVALKVAGWKAEKGSWPSGLEEVLEEGERENPATGREFVYVAGEEAGGGFWLMAVGLEEWKLGEWRGGMSRREYFERKKEEWE